MEIPVDLLLVLDPLSLSKDYFYENILKNVLCHIDVSNVELTRYCRSMCCVLSYQKSLLREDSTSKHDDSISKILDAFMTLLCSETELDSEVIDLSHKIIGLCLFLMSEKRACACSNRILTKIFENFKDNFTYCSNKPQTIHNDFRFLETYLSVEKSSKLPKLSDDLVLILANMAFSTNHQFIINKLLNDIFPLLISLNYRLLTRTLWLKINDSIIGMYNERNDPSWTNEGCGALGKLLLISCALSDFYLNLKDTCTEVCKFQFEESFWRMLQMGLIAPDFLHRKQALYLLKRSVDYFHVKGITFREISLIQWDESKSNLLQLWENVFFILEVLEEKQVHLITPALPMLDQVLGCDQNFLHPTWLLAIFHRILQHDSKTIVKWGVLKLMEIDVCIYCQLTFSRGLIIDQILSTLNDMNMFNSNSDENSVTEAITAWFVKWSLCCHQNSFFIYLLNSLTSMTWGPIPLFYIIYSLSHVQPTPRLKSPSIIHIKDFLSDQLKTQNVFIRAAIQCKFFKCFTLLVNVKDLSISEIADIFGSFQASESFKRNTKTWFSAVSWLSSNISIGEVITFVNIIASEIQKSEHRQNSLTSSAIARMLVLFYDSNLLDLDKSIPDLFRIIRECFDQCDKRAYSCLKTQEASLELIIHLLNECHYQNINAPKDQIVKFVHSFIDDLMKFIKVRLSSPSESLMASIDTYISFIQAVTQYKYLFAPAFQAFPTLHNIASEILQNPNSVLFQKYFAIRLVELFLQASIDIAGKELARSLPKVDVTLEMIFDKLLKNQDNSELFHKKNLEKSSYLSGVQNCFGKFASGIVQATWSLLNIYLSSFGDKSVVFLNSFAQSDLIDAGLNTFSIGVRECIVHTLLAFQHIFKHKCIDVSNIETFLSTSWEACYEHRKTELFWQAINSWIKMAFQKQLIEREECRQILLHYAKQIALKGEAVFGLFSLLVSQFHCLATNTDLTYFSDVIASATLYGTVLRKDQKIEMETCKFIHALGDECSVNYLMPFEKIRSDKGIRIKGLDIVISSTSFDKRDLVGQVVNTIIVKNEAFSKERQRCFNDSIVHRVKNRSLQVLLFLEAFINKHQKEIYKDIPAKLFQFVIHSLMGETQLPSVRYQLEWLFIRLSLHFEHLRKDFWDIFNKAKVERIGSVCSFIAIAYHLANILRDYSFTEKCVENILPWCMTQHFSIRLYAQTVLQKLWSLFETLPEKYVILQESQHKVFDHGDALLNVKKLQNNFYFNDFRPIEHFTLQTIFYDMPRLSKVAPDEWLSLQMFEEHFTNSLDFVELGSTQNNLSGCTASWVVKDTEKEETVSNIGSIQKKFVPWKGMGLSQDNSIERTLEGMIVVASLIDKLPNLGGLSRTCEIFQAKELVIGSLKYIQDIQFTSLSTSAEKHIFISEVKPHNLREYLKEKKRLGYTLIGAEQTSNSVSLNEFSFPKQSLLLLGNEREGIPVDLLLLLDKCVEIEQFGVVRSLNVHVTGSIFLWEYAKQHHSQSPEA